MKVAIIGAGNVGAMVASRVIDANLADVVLVDVVPGLAKGKALDISDTKPITHSTSHIVGTGDFSDIKGCEVVIVTAGLARKPGMSRDDLLKKNADIVKEVSGHIKKHCPSSIVIMVTNPLDVMAYLAMKVTGFDPKKVIGMAGVLDRARFISILSAEVKNIDDSAFFILGSHSDSMVPIKGSLSISEDMFKEVSGATKNRGAEIVNHLGSGSAYFAPSAGVFYMLKAIIKNEKKLTCISAYLTGQYGENDVYAGVPVILDSSGIREIVDISMAPEEKSLFKKSVQEIRENIHKLQL